MRGDHGVSSHRAFLLTGAAEKSYISCNLNFPEVHPFPEVEDSGEGPPTVWERPQAQKQSVPGISLSVLTERNSRRAAEAPRKVGRSIAACLSERKAR